MKGRASRRRMSSGKFKARITGFWMRRLDKANPESVRVKLIRSDHFGTNPAQSVQRITVFSRKTGLSNA